MFLFLLILFSLTYAYPQCYFICPNGTCNQICKPYCESASCEVCHNDTGTPVCDATNECNVHCPHPTPYVNDTCPECEVQCPGSLCGEDDPHCFITCLAPACSWDCKEPSDSQCPQPFCERVCEEVSCPFTGAGSGLSSHFTSLSLGLILVGILFI